MPRESLIRLAALVSIMTAAGSGHAAAQANDGQELTVPSVGLSMRIPAGWHEGGFSGESVLASYIEGTGLHPGFSITREDHGGIGPRAVFDAWTELLPSPVVRVVDERRVSGHDAVFGDVSWSSLLGGLRAIRLIVAVDRQVLVVSFVDREDNLTDEGAEAYAAFLATLALSPPR